MRVRLSLLALQATA